MRYQRSRSSGDTRKTGDVYNLFEEALYKKVRFQLISIERNITGGQIYVNLSCRSNRSGQNGQHL